MVRAMVAICLAALLLGTLPGLAADGSGRSVQDKACGSIDTDACLTIRLTDVTFSCEFEPPGYMCAWNGVAALSAQRGALPMGQAAAIGFVELVVCGANDTVCAIIEESVSLRCDLAQTPECTDSHAFSMSALAADAPGHCTYVASWADLDGRIRVHPELPLTTAATDRIVIADAFDECD